MAVTEPELSEKYQRASDMDLLELARQERSRFGTAAWDALMAELTRRGLPVPPLSKLDADGSTGKPATNPTLRVPRPPGVSVFAGLHLLQGVGLCVPFFLFGYGLIQRAFAGTLRRRSVSDEPWFLLILPGFL